LGFYTKDENTFLAIKEIPVKATLDITDSLLQEINVMRKLKHNNVVTFIDAKKNEDYMYLVT
jgi:serine/threonine-protein kinase ULK/ATG1